MNENFLCTCGHRNKMHTSREDALKWRNHIGRMCIEYKDYPNLYHSEEICRCNNFVPDNLKYLEQRYEEKQK